MKLEDIDRRIAEWKEIMIQAKARVDSYMEIREEFEQAPSSPRVKAVRTPRRKKAPVPPKQSSPIVGIGDQVVEVLAGWPKGEFTSRGIAVRVKEALKQRGFKFPDRKVAARTQQVMFEILNRRKQVAFSVVDTGETALEGGKKLKIYRKE